MRAKKSKIASLLIEIRRNKFSYLIALPAMVYVFIFSYMSYPYMVIAFQRYSYKNHTILDLFTKGEWIGLNNFKFFFTSTNAFLVTYNTIFLNLLFILTGTFAAVLLALLLNEMRNKWFLRVTQSVMLFPNYISWIVVCYILLALFSNQLGFVNATLKELNMTPVNWYTEPKYWPGILAVVRVLKSAGMNSVIYLAAITGIDSSLFEAARIDGANRWQLATKITLPLITPTIFILTLLSIGRIMFGDFGMIYALLGDNGTLYQTTDIIDTYVFRALRKIGDPSQAMAIGLFQSAIGFIMVYGSNRLTQLIYPDGALY